MKGKLRAILRSMLAILLVVGIGTAALNYGYRAFWRATYPLAYTEEVERYAQRFELPPSLIYGIIYTESRFRPDAVSSAEAKGLMQLMDGTFTWVLEMMGEESGDVFDPDTNIRCGTKVLDILTDEFSEIETALAAYNAGIGNVRKWLKDDQYSDDGKTLHTIPFEETRRYVERVTEAQTMYQNLYDIP